MAESWRKQLQRTLNRALNPIGLHLTRADHAFEMDGILRRAVARGFQPATVIDVGASDGSWSIAARRHFPRAKFVLFEPLQEQAPTLFAVSARQDFEIIFAVAGAAQGETLFSVDADLDGSGVDLPDAAGIRSVPVETIDHVLSTRQLTGPYCLKLDTHGYELAVLEGATTVLRADGLIVIEAYNFQLTENCLRFHQLCAWMETRGWRCCDLADPLRRPGDGLLWQLDLVFAPASSAWFANHAYR